MSCGRAWAVQVRNCCWPSWLLHPSLFRDIEELAGAGQIRLPTGVEYEDMLRVVIRWIEKADGTDTRDLTEFAFWNAWSCKK